MTPPPRLRTWSSAGRSRAGAGSSLWAIIRPLHELGHRRPTDAQGDQDARSAAQAPVADGSECGDGREARARRISGFEHRRVIDQAVATHNG